MKRFLLMVALIATLSVAFVIPAHADDPWQCTFDFTIAENGFAARSSVGKSCKVLVILQHFSQFVMPGARALMHIRSISLLLGLCSTSQLRRWLMSR